MNEYSMGQSNVQQMQLKKKGNKRQVRNRCRESNNGRLGPQKRKTPCKKEGKKRVEERLIGNEKTWWVRFKNFFNKSRGGTKIGVAARRVGVEGNKLKLGKNGVEVAQCTLAPKVGSGDWSAEQVKGRREWGVNRHEKKGGKLKRGGRGWV